MIYLILCICLNAFIFIFFRIIGQLKIDVFPVIVINYAVCVITGIFFSYDTLHAELSHGFVPWMYFALGLGFVFLGTFYLMASVTQRFSISVSSISAKISLVIPVLFSLFVLKTQAQEYNWLNYLGMAGSLGAIVLSSLKEKKVDVTDIAKSDLWLPFSLFFLNGIIDTSLNFVSNKFLSDSAEAIFPIGIFLVAALVGFIILIIKKERITRQAFIAGIVLGVINYFSVFTLVRSLSANNDDGAFVYPVLNLGIIIVASLVSLTFFREKFSRLNWTGFIVAIVSLLLLSYQSLF